MNKEEKGREITLTFDNMYELFDYIQQNDKNKLGPYYSETYEKESYFCKWSWKEAVEMLGSGWKEGVDKMMDITANINDKISAKSADLDVYADVQGEFIDMGAVMEGVPECFGRMDLAPAKRSELYVMVSSAYSCGIHEDTIYNRGAAIVSLLEHLKNRYHVILQISQDVAGITPGRSPHGKYKYNTSYNISIKVNVDTSRDFSRDMAAFCLANPAFLRRIMFKVEELLLETNECGGGYGHPADVKDVPNHAIVFQSLIYNNKYFQDADSAAAYITKLLKQYE